MVGAAWQGLLQNLAVLAILVSIWTHGFDWIEGRPRWWREALGSVLAGGGVILLMATPFEFQRGITIDLRYSLIGLAGFLGGPLIGAFGGLVAASYRIYLGGIGSPAGVISITIATIIGAAGGLFLRGRLATVTDLLLLAAACSIFPLASTFILPLHIMTPALASSALPLATMTFLGIMLAGLAMIEAERRRETAHANRFYRSIIEALPEPLNAKDVQGRFLAANPATARQLGAPDVAAVIGKTDFDFHSEEVVRDFRADEERVLARGEAETIEQVLVRDDGPRVWLSTLKAPLRNRSGAIIGLLTHNRDITERKRLEDELANGRRRLADAMEHMADGLVMFDRDARLVLCNEQYRRMFPATAERRTPGARLEDILRASIERGEQTDIPADKVDAWIAHTRANFTVAGETDIHMADGRWLSARVRPTADGGSLVIMTDVTTIKLAEATLTERNQRLANLVREDALTGLLNRRGYDEALRRAFGQARRSGSPLSLLLVDVDHFKPYNDTYGHQAGDACLRTIGNLLRMNAKRPSDVAARYGGEEFTLILPDTPAEGAMRLAEKLRQSIVGLGVEHHGSKAGFVTVSIGIATMEGGSIERDADLTANADAALYAAKAGGRNRTAFFEPNQRPC